MLGRFLQRDPAPYHDDINLYRYVSNNPINWIDPYGLDKQGNKGTFPGGIYTPQGEPIPLDPTPLDPSNIPIPETMSAWDEFWMGMYKDLTSQDPSLAVELFDILTAVPTLSRAFLSQDRTSGWEKAKATGIFALTVIPIGKVVKYGAKVKIGGRLPSFAEHGYKYIRSSSKFRKIEKASNLISKGEWATKGTLVIRSLLKRVINKE